MQNCCLEGCESYKYNSKQKISYFKFPLHNKSLLKKWLNQIRMPNWQPTGDHYICSTHFHVDDINFSNKTPKLKHSAVPMIFPLKHFQSIYVDEINSPPAKKIKKENSASNWVKTEKISDFNNSENSQLGSKKAASVVLLCTPTSQTSKISELQINTLSSPNICMKKIPLKNEIVKNDDLNSTNLSSLNPYILIISDKETRIPLKNAPTKNKQAILKIQIEKKINCVSSNKTIINSSKKQNKYNKKNEINEINEIYETNETNKTNKTNETSEINDINITKDLNSPEKRHLEEVEVDDVSSSKVVVFKFDSSTGKITVVKKEKPKNNIGTSQEISNIEKPISIVSIESLNPNLNENSIDVNTKSHHFSKNQQESIVIEDDQTRDTTEILNINTDIKKDELKSVNDQVKNKKNLLSISKGDVKIHKNEFENNSSKTHINKVVKCQETDQNSDSDICVVTSNVGQKRKFAASKSTNLCKDKVEKSQTDLKKVKTNDFKTIKS